LRSPHLSRRERQRRIDGKLAELGLNERRNYVVGRGPEKKILSGGERKRLNIGLDMIRHGGRVSLRRATSGPVLEGFEHVIDIIRGMSHNKIVLVTIHQPTSKIFQMFHKAVLLDRGGKLVFFGHAAGDVEILRGGGAPTSTSAPTWVLARPAVPRRPEFIFDVLETPLRDLSGDIIFEENNRGQLVPARRIPRITGVINTRLIG